MNVKFVIIVQWYKQNHCLTEICSITDPCEANQRCYRIKTVDGNDDIYQGICKGTYVYSNIFWVQYNKIAIDSFWFDQIFHCSAVWFLELCPWKAGVIEEIDDCCAFRSDENSKCIDEEQSCVNGNATCVPRGKTWYKCPRLIKIYRIFDITLFDGM